MTNLNENSSSPSGNDDLSENFTSSAQAVAILLKTHNDMIANLYKALSDLSSDTRQRIVSHILVCIVYT